MRIKLITIFSATIVVLSIMVPFLVFGETPLFEVPELPKEPLIPGRVEGAGTYFQIEDSEYLNITLKSIEEIKVILESIPRMISLDIEAGSESIDSAELIIEGLEPNKTYYKYQDSYKNEAVFVSDENGSYNWAQDLTQPHHIWIQEIKGTIFLPEKENKYGTWDELTRTYTLNQDLSENVEIIESDFTFDGNGHSISGNGTGYGIYLSWGKANNVVIKNTVIENFGDGILLWFSWGVKIENNHILNNSVNGLRLISSSEIILNNKINFNQNSGIYYYARGGETISGLIRGNDISNNEFGMYLNNQGGWSGGTSIVDNILNSNNYGLLLRGTYFYDSSSNNKIKNNYFLNNTLGLYLAETTKDNVIYHNNFLNNINQIYNEGINNLFDNGYLDGGNYWSDYIGVDSDNDGIGDTPYIFPGGQDNYPFIIENGWKAPPVPTYNVAVVLAETSDVFHESSSITAQPCKLLPKKTYPNGHNKEYYQDLLYCVADYHKENSFGKVNLNFEIYDNDGEWFKIHENENFIAKAINLAISTGIDLSKQDIVIIVEAGRGGGAYSGGSGTAYQIIEIDPSTGQIIDFSKILIGEKHPLGAWMHEIGHVIGNYLTPQNTATPDLYDMGNVEKWDVMARGAWNGGPFDVLFILGDGTNPPYMSSYTKEFLGWLNYDIHPKSSYDEYWINSLTTSNFGDFVFRYNLCDTEDDCSKYYILEARNRNLKTWDSSLPQGKALVLYYVDSRGWPKYGYNLEGRKMNIQNWTINIPANTIPYLDLTIEDGILNPTNDIYRDFDNLVKFITITDKLEEEKYEIKTKIEEITHDSFSNKFWGAILRPKGTLKEKTKGYPIFKNPLGLVGTNKQKFIDPLYAFGREFQEESIISKSAIVSGSKEIFRDLAKGILRYLLFPLLFLNFFVILFNKKVRGIKEVKKPLRIFKKLVFTVIVFIVSAALYFLIGATTSPWILVPFVLFLIYLNVRELKTGDRLVKISLKILWIIIIITVIGITSLWIYSFTRPSEAEGGVKIQIKQELQQQSPISELITLPDLDLHLYCDDGKHIGMNYETGEFENQIEEAIVSGNNQDAPEWIFIPENINDCRYVVSSYNNQRFLEENPEIAQEIEDTTDSYEIYARYIDNETAIYTSAIISEEIEAGEELEQPIRGTTDISVLSAIPWITAPKQLKEEVIQKLEQAKTGEKIIDRRIDLVIRYLNRSLDDKLWLGASRFDPKHGQQVFHQEHKAVVHMYYKIKMFEKEISTLNKVIENKQKRGLDTNKEESKLRAINIILPVFEQAIDDLVKADEILAKIILNEAKNTEVKNPKFQNIVIHQIEKAEREFTRAYEELEEDKPAEVIIRFGLVWRYSQLAIKFALDK